MKSTLVCGGIRGVPIGPAPHSEKTSEFPIPFWRRHQRYGILRLAEVVVPGHRCPYFRFFIRTYR